MKANLKPTTQKINKRKVRRVVRQAESRSVGILDATLAILKFLDNAICHWICGIGMWHIATELGYVAASYNHMLGLAQNVVGAK